MRKLKKSNLSVFFMLFVSLLVSCTGNNSPKKAEKMDKNENHLEWALNANIYEVNIRQYTKEGTIEAFAAHLPRLKEMGVDILWLMPIFPISEAKKKGSLGSCYAVSDYKAVNPDYGNLEDLKSLVAQAHKLGMKVILDWVANHTGWDNVIMEKHKDWYTQNEKGEIIMPAGTDWSDTADLNYDNKELRKYMINCLEYWITAANIDGYRCDMAAMVPTDFWNDARVALDKIKPVFMLAEAWEPELLDSAFDMGYGWDFHHLMNDIAKGEKKASDIDAYFTKMDTVYKADHYLMNFIDNHDENSWAGTINERMGNSANTFAVLSYTVPGMGMMYSGQEAMLNHRLLFFEKDEIKWDNKTLVPFYTQLNKLKASNKALYNGITGGKLVRVNSSNDNVYAFSREAFGDKIVAIFNLSKEKQKVTLSSEKLEGSYKNYFTGEDYKMTKSSTLDLQAWEYIVLVK